MNRTKAALAAALLLGFAASANAGDYQRHSGRHGVQQMPQTSNCNPCAPARPRVVYRERDVRKVVGYRKVEVRRPIYHHEKVIEPVVSAPVQPAPCGDCAVDLTATFVDCVVRDGHTFWRYRASDGMTYRMDVERRGQNDLIRRYPDGRVAWVKG